MMRMMTFGGNPAFGRLGPAAERNARDFEALLGKLESGEAVETGALTPDDPAEFEDQGGFAAGGAGNGKPYPCPSALSDNELIAALQEAEQDRQK